jgi:hypothetical protein
VFTTRHTLTQTLQHTTRLIITITQTIQIDMATQLRLEITTVRQAIMAGTKLLLRPITPLLTTTTLTITTMDTFIILIMMARMEEHTTGTLIGGMHIGN